LSDIEKTINVIDVDAQAVYGANNKYLNTLKAHFPKLKITARGSKIIANGNSVDLEEFESKLNLMMKFVQTNNHITENQLERIISENAEELEKSVSKNNHNGSRKICKNSWPFSAWRKWRNN